MERVRVIGHAVTELDFTLTVAGRTVPGIAWLPSNVSTPCPLVLIGHGGTFGGTGNKRAPSQVSLGTALAGRHGLAAAAIDMPGAGDRPEAAAEAKRRDGMSIEAALRDLWTEESIANTVADWQAAIAYLQGAAGLGDAPLGYFGLSGGTMFGLPLVAQEPRITVAVLGLNGAVPMMMRHAPAVHCRVLYIHNLDDQFGATTTGLELFGALGTADKRFHAFPGGHGTIPADEHDYIAAFLASGLASGAHP
jgi:pimeloyl-ACP methyl ester carboxylesterase